MRLICPNCGAQYEVPDEVVPETGRDVQCSNCGATWFQAHPSYPHHADPGPEPEQGETDQHDWAEVEEDENVEAETQAQPTAEKRRELDPDVANVLREEASREAQVRAAESGSGLETQPDLGLSQGDDDKRSHQAKARMARLRGMAPPEDTVGDEDDIDPGTRRNLLPDIEEVSSSIASAPRSETEDRSARDGTRVEAQEPAGPGGFRRGMRLAIILAIIATAVYIFAPQLADAVPALSGPLASYVGAVNEGRLALNGLVVDIVTWIRALIGE